MPDINLLDNQQFDAGEAVSSITRTGARLLLILVIASILSYALLFFLSYQTQNNLEKLTVDIQAKQAEISSNKNRNEVVTRQGQVKELNTLIDKHLYWSYLIPELARVTLNSAKYTDIKASSDGKLDLTVNLPSYDDIEKFMQIFDLPQYNEQFSNVRIVNITKTQTDSTIQTVLTLQLTFNPAFIKGKM